VLPGSPSTVTIPLCDLHPHPPNYSRRVVLLLVDSYDLATIAAIRYAIGMVGIDNDGRPAMINPAYDLLG
jgi:hypothetical protein